jgi:hypothetical protein
VFASSAVHIKKKTYFYLALASDCLHTSRTYRKIAAAAMRAHIKSRVRAFESSAAAAAF